MHDTAKRDLERLVNLTDAALAITLTLMMLEIRLPEPPGEMSDGALLDALLAIWPRYLTYALSFVVVGLFWISHRQKFRHIVRGDAVIVWLNIAFLLVLGLVPFATDVIAENGGRVATIFYAGVMAVDSLILFLLWWYALSAGLTEPDLPKEERRRGLLVSGIGMLVFLLSVPIAFYDADLAKYFWLLLLAAPFTRHLLHASDPAA
jgi:uncharacterized membrane protein